MRIPKSMAPIDSKFAGTPRACKKINEKSNARGIVSATITAARIFPKKKHQDDEDKSHPQHHIVLDRVDCQLNEIASVVIRPYFYVGWQNVFIELLCFFFDTLQYILRLLAAPHHDDALDGVIRFVKPNSPKRGAFPMVTSPMSWIRTGTPFCVPTMTLPMSEVSRTSPRPRT